MQINVLSAVNTKHREEKSAPMGKVPIVGPAKGAMDAGR